MLELGDFRVTPKKSPKIWKQGISRAHSHRHEAATPSGCIGLSIAEVREKRAHDATQPLCVWLAFSPEAVNQLIPNRKELQQRLELLASDFAGGVEFAHKRRRRQAG